MATFGGANIVTDNLVLWLDAANRRSYPGSGTTWNDMSGNGNNGTLTNGPTFSSANNGSIVFDGVDDYVECGNNASLNFGTGDFTVSVWFKRFSSATTNLRLLSKGSETNLSDQAGFTLFGSNDAVVFGVNPTGTRSLITAATYNLNEWVNVVGILERGASMRAYKNATLSNTTTAPVGSITGVEPFRIGRSSTNGFNWIGVVANTQIYNRALSASEVQQNYDALKSRYLNQY